MGIIIVVLWRVLPCFDEKSVEESVLGEKVSVLSDLVIFFYVS